MNRSVPKETLKMERDFMRPDKLQITCTKTDGVVLVLGFGILFQYFNNIVPCFSIIKGTSGQVRTCLKYRKHH